MRAILVVAADSSRALADADINIHMISTSESQVSLLLMKNTLGSRQVLIRNLV